MDCIATARSRRVLALLVLILATCWITLASPTSSRVWAQDDDGEKAAEPAKSPADAVGPSPSLFKHIIKSAGIVFGPLLLLISIGLVALIVLLAMDLRMSAAIPPEFVEDFADTLNKRDFKGAFELAKEDGSFLARVITTGMSRLQYGIEDAREAAFNMVDSIRAGKEQAITYLATIGTLGPMIGLVGTVYGMIISFMELGQPGKTPRPDKLAEGISHALVVTLLGIGLSVPAIFCHAFFRNRLIRISMDTSNIADDLLTQMYHNSKKAAPVPAVPAGNAMVAATVKQK